MSPDTTGQVGRETSARFTVDVQPSDPELAGTGRFALTKTWTGGLAGTSRGAMLSAGDPSTGRAGYVALEIFEGTVDGRSGTVAFLQLGTAVGGGQSLTYVVAPGSGTGELAGITGTVELSVVQGRHEVRLRYTLG
jgi:hypothetical protein